MQKIGFNTVSGVNDQHPRHLYLLSHGVGGELLGLHVQEVHLAAEGQEGQQQTMFGHLQTETLKKITTRPRQSDVEDRFLNKGRDVPIPFFLSPRLIPELEYRPIPSTVYTYFFLNTLLS